MIVFGTRPEAIKIAPVISELAKTGSLKPIVTVTAQHREMLDQVLDVFSIRPDYDLNIMRPNQKLSEISTRSISALEKVIQKERPEMVLIQGDTTTAFIGALMAFYNKIPVGHIEAGLRTHDKYNPFPEEINRRLISVLSDLHFAPTKMAYESLAREGIEDKKIYITGNTVIDSLLGIVKTDYEFNHSALNKIDFGKKKIILVTIHRRENWGIPLKTICLALKKLAEKYSNIEIIYPVHPNLKIREVVKTVLKGNPQIHLLPPLNYELFSNLMNRSYLILTDSGGIQEEASFLGKPVLILRKVTERTEIIKVGTAKLLGTEKDRIVHEASKLLTDKDEYSKMAKSTNFYGDGQASKRICEALLYWFKITRERPVNFKVGTNNA